MRPLSAVPVQLPGVTLRLTAMRSPYAARGTITPMRSLLLTTLVVVTLGACASRSVDDKDETDSETSGMDDAELRMLCEVGCIRFETCAPNEMATLYGDRDGCEVGCYDQFAAPAACRAAAEDYANCTAALDCADWPDLLDGPDTSLCADEWAEVAPVCDLG